MSDQPINLDNKQAILYLNKYPDLKKAFGNNIKKAQEHWINFGIKEGRTINETYNNEKHNSIAFCFLVVGDLIKENVWINWFDRLEKLGLNVNIYVHCSNPANIKSEWLKKYLIPSEYLCPTKWAYVMKASFNMYRYAFNNKNNDWFINISETHVPYISPKKFMELYNKYYDKTILSFRKPWWDVKTCNRSNLKNISEKHCYGHHLWCIISNYDMKLMIELINNKNSIVLKTIDTGFADESIIAVYLSYLDRLQYTVNDITTIVDWSRSIGSSPYTFNNWTINDEDFLDQFILNNKNVMFIRKIGKSFLDNIIYNWWDYEI